MLVFLKIAKDERSNWKNKGKSRKILYGRICESNTLYYRFLFRFYQDTRRSCFHTGDFKIDLTPVDGDGVDFARLAELGDEGVDLLLSDSTNSEVEGFTPSEKVLEKHLNKSL